jgi:hypothetical protein
MNTDATTAPASTITGFEDLTNLFNTLNTSKTETPLNTLNKKQAETRRSKARDKSLKLRNQLWSEIDANKLWTTETKVGYSNIPRTLPMFMNIIDDLSKSANDKGKSAPAGKTYLVLWSRLFDHAFVTITNEAAAAFEAGYSGERSVTTWRQHLKVLKTLGFIDYKPGQNGDYEHILIFNPYQVVMQLKDKIQDRSFNALYQRALEIGADSELDQGK